ncbi:MAG: iron-containing alcohol dehydrogenase [Betaproteobacteria bacterium]|nr:iron-containing alcohol dehydrogenase [Betaproteobacteria bacterium]
MNNFSFYNPVRIHFGAGQIKKIADEIPAGAKVLITYGGGSVFNNGVMQQVEAVLAGRDVLRFGGIEPNPAYETLMKAVLLAREQGVDYLLAVGGGSVLDGTKFIAAAVPFEGEPWDILAHKARVESALPIGTVLTLPATGSESNAAAVVSRRATGDKLSFFSGLIFPRFAVLDPETTYSLPPRQIGNGVVDAFVHVVEQYLTFPCDAKIQDRFAEGILLTLIEEGPKAFATPNDYAVRANLMWAATMALQGVVGAGVPQDWSTHALGHEITAMYGLDHAQTLAIVLPAMLHVRRASKREKLLQYAERVWNLSSGDEEARIDAAIEKTRAFFEAMQVKTSFSGYGIAEPDFNALLAKLQEHSGGAGLGERRDVTLEVSRQVFELAR